MRYDELPVLADTGEHHAWEVFGPHDELGTLNRLTPPRVAEAARLVTSGRVISVNLTLDVPGPLADERSPYRHDVEVRRLGRDDRLDDFYPQGSTQWDGLRHIRFRQHGYFGGRQEDDLDRDGSLGIDRLAARGIVGRGVLLDVARSATHDGQDWRVQDPLEITAEMLESSAARQEVRIREGDILMIRTGWLAWYLALDEAERKRVGTARTMSCVGLDPGKGMAAWLWDRGVAAVACDNVAVEVLPIRPDRGFLHRRLLALLGMLMGELWNLDPLAEDCRADGRYEGLLVSAPLALPGGAGSPANAYVIK